MTSPAPSYSSLLSQHSPVAGHVGIKVGMKVGIRVCPSISSKNIITVMKSQNQYSTISYIYGMYRKMIWVVKETNFQFAFFIINNDNFCFFKPKKNN